MSFYDVFLLQLQAKVDSISRTTDEAIVMNWPWNWHSIFTFPECASGLGIHVDLAPIWSARYSLLMLIPVELRAPADALQNNNNSSPISHKTRPYIIFEVRSRAKSRWQGYFKIDTQCKCACPAYNDRQQIRYHLHNWRLLTEESEE